MALHKLYSILSNITVKYRSQNGYSLNYTSKLRRIRKKDKRRKRNKRHRVLTHKETKNEDGRLREEIEEQGGDKKIKN